MDARAVTREAMVPSALISAGGRGDRLPRDRIILSAKVSAVQDLITVYSSWHAAPLRASSGSDRGRDGLKGIVASTARRSAC